MSQQSEDVKQISFMSKPNGVTQPVELLDKEGNFLDGFKHEMSQIKIKTCQKLQISLKFGFLKKIMLR